MNKKQLRKQYDELLEERREFIEVTWKKKHHDRYEKYDEPYPHIHTNKTTVTVDKHKREVKTTVVVSCTKKLNCFCDRTGTEWHKKYCPPCREFMRKESELSKRIDGCSDDA